MTLLMEAARRGRLDIVRLLVQHLCVHRDRAAAESGDDPNRRNEEGRTAFDVAARQPWDLDDLIPYPLNSIRNR